MAAIGYSAAAQMHFVIPQMQVSEILREPPILNHTKIEQRCLARARRTPAGSIEVLLRRDLYSARLGRLFIADPVGLRVEAVHQVGQGAEQECAESLPEAPVDPDPQTTP